MLSVVAVGKKRNPVAADKVCCLVSEFRYFTAVDAKAAEKI